MIHYTHAHTTTTTPPPLSVFVFVRQQGDRVGPGLCRNLSLTLLCRKHEFMPQISSCLSASTMSWSCCSAMQEVLQAYYSNRSAAFAHLGKHESALNDANKCLERDPSFIKGALVRDRLLLPCSSECLETVVRLPSFLPCSFAYSRKGTALFELGKLDEAEAAYTAGAYHNDAVCCGARRRVSTMIGLVPHSLCLDREPNYPACADGVQKVKTTRAVRAARSSASGGGSGLIAKLQKGVQDIMRGNFSATSKRAMRAVCSSAVMMPSE